MANITTVGLTSGLGTSGTGTVSTLDNLVGTAGTANANVLSVQGIASGTAQPVSMTSTTITGTVAATQSGTWTVQPGNTANTTAWKVDGSAVTQPISGSVTATQGTGTNLHTVVDSGSITAVQGTGTNLHTVVDSGTVTANATLAAETTKVIGTVNLAATPTTNLANIDSQTSRLVTSATRIAPGSALATTSFVAGSRYNSTPPTFTDGQEGALQIDSAGRLIVNIGAGASSGAVAQGSTTSGQTGSLIQGAVTTSSPTYTTAQTSPLSLDTTGALRVNVTAGGAGGGIVTQATGSNLHTVVDSGTVTTVSTVTNLAQLGGTAVSMNTGTRDAGTQRVTIATNDVVPASQSGTWTVQPGNTANTTPWLAKIGDGTNAVSVKAASTAPLATDPALVVGISPNSVNANGNAIPANSAPVVTSNPNTGTQTSVASSATDVTILASNANRRMATIFNDSTQILYLLLASGTSSTSNYSVQITASGYYEVPGVYTGVLKGIWASANGNARVTELT